MAYTESHQALRNHPKTKRLAVALGVSKVEAIGHLHCLWWWALDYAPDGDLSPFAADEIADGAMWEGDPAALTDALARAGFVDPDGALHDWDQYGGKVLAQKEGNARRQREFRDRHRNGDGEPHPAGPQDPATVTSPLRNALDKRREEKRREEDVPPLGSPPAADAAAPPGQTIPLPVRSVPKPVPRPVPQPFEVTPDLARAAAGYGLSPPQVVFETEKFLDHFRATGERKADWAAAWRNWMRRVPEFGPVRAPPGRASPNGKHAIGLSNDELEAIARGESP